MPAVEINLTTEQLVAAYAQLNRRERRSFLEAMLTQLTDQRVALETLTDIQAILRRKFSPAKQRLLDKLLDANNERALRPAEQEQLDELMAEYGTDLVAKARARYLLELSNRALQSQTLFSGNTNPGSSGSPLTVAGLSRQTGSTFGR